VLEQFCDFIRDVYSPGKVHRLEENYKHKQATGHPAAFISDMYVLYLFYRQYKDQHCILDLSPIRDGATYDYNISEWPGLDRERTYELNPKEFYGVKKFQIRDGKVYCYNKKLDQVVQFKNLHFAGYNKMLVHRYYQGKSNPGLYLKREWPLLQWNLRRNLRLRTRLNQMLAPLRPAQA
jgi:hypothetical protein